MQSAAKVIEAIAERAVDTQALKLKQGNDVDKLLAAIGERKRGWA